MENVKLYYGECLKIMDQLIEDGVKVDAIICDPPYGTITSVKDCEWDIILPMDKMWERLKKIRKNLATPIILFGNDPFSYKLKNSNHLEYRYPIIWDKVSTGQGMFVDFQPLRQFEEIMVFYNQSEFNEKAFNYHLDIKNHFENLGYKKSDIAKLLGYVQVRNLFIEQTNKNEIKSLNKLTEEKYLILSQHFKEFDWLDYESYLKLWENAKTTYNPQKEGKRNPTNIWRVKKITNLSLHPTQKPIELMEKLVLTFSNKGDTVLDFTMGSGSTGVACVNTGRKFIGIELNEKYFETAKERIEKEQNQVKLF